MSLNPCEFSLPVSVGSKRTKGFTLVELLVAIGLLVVVSAMAFRGLDQIIAAEERLSREYRFWRAINIGTSSLVDDLMLASPRSIRKNSGKEAALMAQPLIELESPYACQLVFTRRAYALTDDVAISQAKRIGYRFSNGRLLKMEWGLLDVPLSSAPTSSIVVLEEIQDARWRFLDPDGAWHDRWPIGNEQDSLPRAVELALVLPDDTVVRRVAVLASSFWRP